MKNALFIYNPISGDHNIPNRLNHIIGRFQDSGILVQPYRLGSDVEEKLPGILKNNNFSGVIAAGGDGTLNTVANIILKNNLDLPVGVIPAGTCNDFAGSLGIPNTLDECLDIILSGDIFEVDVGLINDDKYFLSTCAGGIFVDVSFNTHNELKKNLGPFAYYLKAITEVANIKSFKMEIKTDTETIKEQALLFLVLNGKHGGGFSNLIREADLTDGLMDIVLFKNCSHIDMAALFIKALTNESLNDKNVTTLRARSCTIKCHCDVLLSVDGEKGPSLPVTIKFINKALKVFTSAS